MYYFRYRQPFTAFLLLIFVLTKTVPFMKIVIDDKIPYIREAAALVADEVVYIAGTEFTPEIIHDADALIVRTRTRCDKKLLEGSKVKFIATATIGFDHIDYDYCKEAGICWANAPGSNSSSVAQYIQSALLMWKKTRHTDLNKLTLGIVGVGNVGKKIAEIAHRLGMEVLLNDPPRAEKEGASDFVSLQEIAEKSDVITFHVPLYIGGRFNTHHLADRSFFAMLCKQPTIINTSRGEVIDTDELLNAMNSNIVSDVIIDVWENEPQINRLLLDKAFISTPHIAGYSADGKANATRMSLDSICDFFHLNKAYQISLPAPAAQVQHYESKEEEILNSYNPSQDSDRLKEHPELFEYFRGNYPIRREISALL